MFLCIEHYDPTISIVCIFNYYLRAIYDVLLGSKAVFPMAFYIWGQNNRYFTGQSSGKKRYCELQYNVERFSSPILNC